MASPKKKQRFCWLRIPWDKHGKKNSRSSLKGFQNWHLCLSPASGTELQMPTKKTTTSGKDMMVFLRTQTPAFKGEQQMK